MALEGDSGLVLDDNALDQHREGTMLNEVRSIGLTGRTPRADQ
jgi:hypothetical protein